MERDPAYAEFGLSIPLEQVEEITQNHPKLSGKIQMITKFGKSCPTDLICLEDEDTTLLGNQVPFCSNQRRISNLNGHTPRKWLDSIFG